MRRIVAVLVVLAAVAAAVIVAVNTSSSGVKPRSQQRRRVTLVAPVPEHPCTLTSFYMQCVGKATPGLISPPDHPAPKRPNPGSAPGSPFFLRGIDFAWGGPAGNTYPGNTTGFACSYLSNSSKDWTYALIHSWVDHGKGACVVRETSAARTLDGYNAGYDDAYQSTHQLATLGYGRGVHIYFATDFDTTNYGNAFLSYYQGAAAWDKRAGDSTGGYGGLHTVQVLCAHGIRPNWQTLAWSYGLWAPASCAPLRQTGINATWAGYSVDYDVAIAANYGQIGYRPAPPPPPAVVCFGGHATPGTAACKQIIANVQGWGRAVTSSNGAYRARGCPPLVATRSVLDRRWHWFSAALRQHPNVKHASRGRALAATSRALNGVRRTITGRGCIVFSDRAAYYSALVSSAEKKYRAR